jgi:hypothetical protein
MLPHALEPNSAGRVRRRGGGACDRRAQIGRARVSVVGHLHRHAIWPFDVFDVPTHFCDSQNVLERKLGLAIEQLSSSLGQYS